MLMSGTSTNAINNNSSISRLVDFGFGVWLASVEVFPLVCSVIFLGYTFLFTNFKIKQNVSIKPLKILKNVFGVILRAIFCVLPKKSRPFTLIFGDGNGSLNKTGRNLQPCLWELFLIAKG